MKRKFSEISKPTKKLIIKVPKYLFCDVCRVPVYLYEYCIGNDIYCGRDCFEVLQLSKKGNFLDEMKRTENYENLMELDTR